MTRNLFNPSFCQSLGACYRHSRILSAKARRGISVDAAGLLVTQLDRDK